MKLSPRFIFLTVFFLSGACGLLYEIVWGRLLGFVFGSSMPAITTVVTCFMAGLAIGSYLGGILSSHIRHPARLYGIIEIAIGGYCVLVPHLLDLALPLYRQLFDSTGQSLVLLTMARILICSAILLFPTILMGATFPLLTAAFARSRAQLGGTAGLLYGINTLGALAGCVAAGFFLLPAIGLSHTILGAAFLNLLAGVLAIRFSSATPSASSADSEAATAVPAAASLSTPIQDPPTRLTPAVLLLTYLLCGFASMACQVAWTRALILVLGASTYAFSAVVACFIAGIALGSLLVSHWLHLIRRPVFAAGLVCALIAASTLAVMPLFSLLPDLVARLSCTPGISFGHVLGVELACIFGILVIPTLCMGALLPLVCAMAASIATRRSTGPAAPPETGRIVGNVYAANTFGSILGTAAAGFVFIPWPAMGMQRTILLSALIGGIVATIWILADAPPTRRRRTHIALAAAWVLAATVIAVVPPWTRAAIASGPFLGRRLDTTERLIFYREGADSTVTVSKTQDTQFVLRINGKPDASTRTADMYTQTLFGMIPISLRPDARSICVIGFGAGITAASVLDAAPAASVNMAEISDAVLDAAPFFAAANGDVLHNPRLTLHRADGRNMLLLSPQSYDIIICEPSNPWISGIANLFSREFLEIARSRLGGAGLHCQWVHSYSMHPDDFGAVLKTMSSVFRHVQVWSMWFGDYLVVGSDQPILLDVDAWKALLDRPAAAARLHRIMITHPLQFAHHYVAEGSDLAPLIQGKKILVDDQPHLEFSAPRYLLSNWGTQISIAMDVMAGTTPRFVPGEDPDAIREFNLRAGNSRRTRRFLRDSVDAAWKKDSRRFLDDYLTAASATPDDGRVFLLILPELGRQLQKVDPAGRQTLVDYVQRICSLSPFFSPSADDLPAGR